MELNRLLLKLVYLCHLNIQESSLKNNAEVLVHAFCGISEILESKIFTPVATMVLPLEYNRFITNVPFWATGMLERF